MTTHRSPDGGRALPLDRYPDPVLGYTLVDGEPTLECINDVFASTFEDVPPGTPLSAVSDRLEITGLDGSASCLGNLSDADDRPVEIPVSDSRTARFLLQVVPHARRANGDDGVGVDVDVDTEDDGSGQTANGPAEELGYVLFIETSAVTPTPVDRSTLGIDRVASVISHDLRNPLDVAKARLRAGRELDEDEHFDHVEQAHDRMERIIEDVLTVARGEDVVDPTAVVDLESVVERAWETVETEGATLTIEGPLPTAVADRDRTGRLFDNLFRNAVEHGGDAPAVTVGRLETEGIDGVYVADDGPGIPADEREYVFEPGYSSREGGTGLGLAIVERITDAHGWSVSVSPSAEGGVRFEIRGIDSEP